VRARAASCSLPIKPVAKNGGLGTPVETPINTSGGQLSAGQAGCAAGFLGLVESIRQLTGRNLARAVPDARLGLAVGFGMIIYDRGLCSGAAILGRADA